MAASVEFIQSCPLNNNNTDVEMSNEDLPIENRQEFEDPENLKLEYPDEKGSESTVDSPYGSVMSENDPTHGGFFPTVKRRGSRGRRFRVRLRFTVYPLYV